MDDSKLDDGKFSVSLDKLYLMCCLVEGEQDQHEMDEKDEVAGFLFGTLKQQHPELEEELGEFKAYLKEGLKEIVELKAWQLQGQSI